VDSKKGLRKQFDEDQKFLIEKLHRENHSVNSIALIMMVGQERVRKYLKEKQLTTRQPNRPVKSAADFDFKIIDVDFPDFSDAACKSFPKTQFFPELEDYSKLSKIKHESTIREAIEICMSCKIQETCLEYALKAEPFGIWGGTTEIERVYLRHKLNIECLREVQMNRFARRTRLNFLSPSMAPHQDELYQKSKAVSKRLVKRG